MSSSASDAPPKQLLYLNLKTEDAASCFRVNHFWVFCLLRFCAQSPEANSEDVNGQTKEAKSIWRVKDANGMLRFVDFCLLLICWSFQNIGLEFP